MKGIKRKVIDENKQVEEKIKNETSNVSEFSEEDDDKNVTFAEILQGDVFEKAQGDINESKKRNDVREDGRKQRGHDEGQKNHDQKSESSREEKTSSKEEGFKQEKISSEKEEEITTFQPFKHGTPKEISVFVTAKVSTLPYENIDISNGITLTLPPNADHKTAMLARAEAYEYCENFIALRVAEIRKAVAGAKK